jgi:hypothetical protein
VTEAQVTSWAESIKESFREDGEELYSDSVLTDLSYADTYRVAMDAGFVELAKQAGYDGLYYRGTFTSDNLFDRDMDLIEKESSFSFF